MQNPQLSIDQLLQEAAQALNTQRLEDARNCLQQVLELDANHFDALHILGVLAFQKGNPSEAEAFIRRALAVDDGFAEAHYNLGKVLRERGRLKEAAEAYQKAVRINDRLDPAWFNLGLVELEWGHHTQAVDAFRRAAEIDPTDPDYPFNLGNALSTLGDVKEARRQFERTVFLDPSYAHAWNNLGIMLRECGEIKEAVDAYQRALDINPRFADAHFNLGNLHEAQGNAEQALACYQQAVKANPKFAKAYNNLAHMYYLQMDMDRARETYETVLEIDPANHTARHMMDALRGTTTQAAPADYVSRLFDKAAPEFEERLVLSLRYQSPKELRQMLDASVPEDKVFECTVDLGCGTGLSGEAFKSRTQKLTGVDLSARMLQKARDKNIYDALHEGGLIEFLDRAQERFDLFIAADVLVYIGDLDPLFQAVRKRASAGAWFLFSVERVDETDFALRPTGRYAHSRSYIESIAEKNGFTCLAFEETVVRMERDEPIPGFNVVTRLSESPPGE
ncbi:tetratricopeptide repeat protein [Nitrospina sp. 32_T5]|uniref:tetratricopeptide repeat protein n=1 Tax=unclassified Nitrospina TaxID=2638683 RepID=UPI003F99E1BE